MENTKDELKCNGHNRCCCRCIYRKTINKHPWNEGMAKGKISELLGYGCSVFNEMDKNQAIIFYDNPHGECEMFVAKDVIGGELNE